MPYNYLSLTVFTPITRTNFVADFLQANCDFRGKRQFCVFEPPFGGLEATYDDHLRLVLKRVGDFLFVLTELSSLTLKTFSAMPTHVMNMCGKFQSINQSFICSEQHKKQVNAQYNVEQDTKA